MPLLVGLVVVALGLSIGVNCGYAINPARDLGPRIFTSFLYGKEVFTAHDYFFWIPIGKSRKRYVLLQLVFNSVGPIIGGTLGAVVYIFMVGGHYEDSETL